MKPARSAYLPAIVIFACLVMPKEKAHAQCPPLYTFTGSLANDKLGWSVAGVGDVNNDGYDDVIVGAPRTFGSGGTGYAVVYSGLDGSVLHTFNGEADSDRFGIGLAGAGDVDKDNYADVIIGAFYSDSGGSNAGRAYVYSGLTGARLYTFSGAGADDYLGFSVSGAVDINNDTYDDVIVGRRTATAGLNRGQAIVFSGLNGDTLHVIDGLADGDELGVSVSGLIDIDGDNFDDFIVGANKAGPSDVGEVYVISGQTGATLYTFTGEAFGDEFGTFVDDAGDLNDDGTNDIIVGARLADTGAVTDIGKVYIYSGASGALLQTLIGPQTGDLFGISVGGVGDINGDLIDDFIVGSWQNNLGGQEAGAAFVYSGVTWELLHTVTGDANDKLGNCVAGAGDINNDGIHDIIVGVREYDGGIQPNGRAFVYTMPGNNCFNSSWTGKSGLLPYQVCPEWITTDNAVPEDPFLRGDTLVVSTSQDAELMRFNQTTSSLGMPDTVVVKFRMKFVSGSSSHSATSGANVSVQFASGLRNILWIDASEIFF